MTNPLIETIVLVDDSKIDNKLHTRVIERTGLVKNILSFTMADDAIKYFRNPGALPASLVFLDINMPRMNGFELLDAAIKEFGERFHPSIIVMLTTSLDPSDKARAGEYTVVREYFQKPLTKEKFISIVESLKPVAPDDLRV